MDIRAAVQDDIEQIAALNKEVHELHVAIEPSIFRDMSEETFHQTIELAFHHEHTSIFVAVDQQTVAGYVVLQRRVRAKNELMHERKSVFIEQVGVLKAYRQQGIFNLLLNKAKALTLDWGFDRLELDVWSNNLVAKQSFLKSGFESFNEKMKIDL